MFLGSVIGKRSFNQCRGNLVNLEVKLRSTGNLHVASGWGCWSCDSGLGGWSSGQEEELCNLMQTVGGTIVHVNQCLEGGAQCKMYTMQPNCREWVGCWSCDAGVWRVELGKTNILHVTSGWATGHVTQAAIQVFIHK